MTSSVELTISSFPPLPFLLSSFAKQAWAWTTAAFFLHLFTTRRIFSTLSAYFSSSPSSPSKTLTNKGVSSSSSKPYLPTIPRLTKYAVATSFWILLTIWLAGPGVTERVMVWTGGECSIQLPLELCSVAGGSVECTAQSAVVVGQNALGAGQKEVMLMTIPEEYCRARLPVTPKSFPALFPEWVEGEKHHRLHARWSGGHDVSGHG